jgi:NAD(P)-dependent dehydrogenase (short-subunit alcohol dehydrogenase family)
VTAGPHPGPRPAGPLAGRVALVTGVSRREQPWGADPGGIEAVLAELQSGPTASPAPPAGPAPGDPVLGRVEHLEADFLDPDAPDQVMASAGELAYATSRAALVGITASLADALADQGITVNTVNPGPTDTDYVDQATRERVATRFPAGRWGAPDDAARLVVWLCTDDAAWVTGQVINSEGGFRRFG